MKKRTLQEFKDEVSKRTNNEYEVLGDYVNSMTHISMLHTTCGSSYLVTPNEFLRGTRCRNCSYKLRAKAKSKGIDKVKSEISTRVGNEYELKSKEYVNNYTKLEFHHNLCGNDFLMSWANFSQGERCPICYGTHKKTTKEYIDEIKKDVGDEYSMIGEYSNNKTKITLKHNICGTTFLMRPNSFSSKTRCPTCYGNHVKDTEIFKQDVFKKEGDSYVVLGEYINNKTPIKLKHIVCGNIFAVKPNHFLNGSRCPKCSNSRMEKKIAIWLSELNINFETQKKFTNCKYKKELPFDFYIDHNNTQCLIEYDGDFHYRPIFNDDDLTLQKKRDNIKTDFCFNNNIPLLRLTCLEKNHKDTLIKFLNTNHII